MKRDCKGFQYQLKGDTDASILDGVKIVQNKTEICLYVTVGPKC
jgi:hypothetical protein